MMTQEEIQAIIDDPDATLEQLIAATRDAAAHIRLLVQQMKETARD